MMILIFVSAVLVSIVLDRQERRHRFEKSWEYKRMGIAEPPRTPKLRRTEAWLNVGLGMLVVAFGILQALISLMIAQLAREQQELFGNVLTGRELEITAFYLAGGSALIVLGWKAVRNISRFEASVHAPGHHRP